MVKCQWNIEAINYCDSLFERWEKNFIWWISFDDISHTWWIAKPRKFSSHANRYHWTSTNVYFICARWSRSCMKPYCNPTWLIWLYAIIFLCIRKYERPRNDDCMKWYVINVRTQIEGMPSNAHSWHSWENILRLFLHLLNFLNFHCYFYIIKENN